MQRFKNIVVGIDLAGREHLVSGRGLGRYSRAAVEKAVWVARKNSARLHMLTTLDVDAHAAELIRRDDASGRATVLQKARARLEDLATPARGAGLAVTTDVQLGHPTDQLLSDIEDNDRDLVVIGTRARSTLARRLLGSTALRMIVRAQVPTWVARQGPDQDFDTVLAPVDFDGVADDVLRLAEGFAAEVGATLHVVHAVDFSAEQVLRAGDADEATITEYHGAREAAARTKFDEVLNANLKKPQDAVRHLVSGAASQQILDLAGNLEADLVVMGTRGRVDFAHRLVGDTAERVLPHLDTSLLIVKPKPGA